MALAPAPGVARVVMKGVIGNVNTANVLHFKGATGTAWSQPDLDSLVTLVKNAVSTHLLPLITAKWMLTEVNAIDLTTDTGLVSVTTAALVGGKAGSSLPSNVAQCISFKTVAHFRGGHCRMYLPPPTFNEVDTIPNTWISAHLTALGTGASGFLTAVNVTIGSLNQKLVMLSRIRGKQPIVGGPVAYVVTGATVDSRIDSQRRRLGKDR